MKIMLLEPITDELARDVITQVSNNQDDTIDVLIMSPGGSVVAGNAIIAALQGAGVTVNTRVIGMAASMAAVISQIGDNREIDEDALFNLHFASVGTSGRGTKEDHLKAVDLLKGINETLVKKLKNSSLGKRDLIKLMEEDRVMTAKEATQLGFFDSMTQPMKAVAFLTNNNDMKKDDLKAFISNSLATIGVNKPVDEEQQKLVDNLAKEAEDKAKETVEAKKEALAIEGSVDILTAEMVKSEDFEAFKNTYTPLMKSLLNVLEDMPTVEDMEKMVQVEATKQIEAILREVRSKTVAPRNASNGFQHTPEVVEDDKTDWNNKLKEIAKNKI
jgi:ATP-dependent Clp protease protease subunit